MVELVELVVLLELDELDELQEWVKSDDMVERMISTLWVSEGLNNWHNTEVTYIYGISWGAIASKIIYMLWNIKIVHKKIS